MNTPVLLAEILKPVLLIAERKDRGEATKQDLQDALVQLEGARRVVGEALVQVVGE